MQGCGMQGYRLCPCPAWPCCICCYDAGCRDVGMRGCGDVEDAECRDEDHALVQRVCLVSAVIHSHLVADQLLGCPSLAVTCSSNLYAEV